MRCVMKHVSKLLRIVEQLLTEDTNPTNVCLVVEKYLVSAIASTCGRVFAGFVSVLCQISHYTATVVRCFGKDVGKGGTVFQFGAHVVKHPKIIRFNQLFKVVRNLVKKLRLWVMR